jgi:hypothetical protein
MQQLPESFLFMKVGNHADEEWEAILERKQREIRDAGQSFWGYGGTACHPTNQVQPFARLTVRQRGGVFLVMEHIDSRAAPEILPATEFSADGVNWQPIPAGINVTGSRYALVLDEILPGRLDLPLNQYEVGVGPSAGTPAEKYLQGRIDKGCFVKSKESRSHNVANGKMIRKVGFTAKLVEPYAVYVR